MFGPLNFAEKLDSYTGVILNYTSFESENLPVPLSLSKWNLTWFTDASYQFFWDINLELYGYVSSGGLEGQIDYDWLAGMEFALSRSFIKDKFKVNLGINKILNRKFKGSIVYDNIDANIVSDWSRQNVYLQLTYNIGKKLNKKKTREKASENERDRIRDDN